MLYLDGRARESELVGWSERWGTMITASSYREPPLTRPWAADSEAYTRGLDWPRFTAWLDTMEPHRERCLFVPCPDVVGDAIATLDRWRRYSWRLRARGWPVAYVGQDGGELYGIPPGASALFIGGTTAWKLGPGARALVAEAKRRGLWVHMGRVNTMRRIRYAISIGCDSVDGTCLCFGADVNAPRLRAALAQPALFTS